jgi:hypothetical protein
MIGGLLQRLLGEDARVRPGLFNRFRIVWPVRRQRRVTGLLEEVCPVAQLLGSSQRPWMKTTGRTPLGRSGKSSDPSAVGGNRDSVVAELMPRFGRRPRALARRRGGARAPLVRWLDYPDAAEPQVDRLLSVGRTHRLCEVGVEKNAWLSGDRPGEGLLTFRVAAALDLNLHLTGSLQPLEGAGAAKDLPCASLLPILPEARGEPDPQGAVGAAKGSAHQPNVVPSWSRKRAPDKRASRRWRIR